MRHASRFVAAAEHGGPDGDSAMDLNGEGAERFLLVAPFAEALGVGRTGRAFRPRGDMVDLPDRTGAAGSAAVTVADDDGLPDVAGEESAEASDVKDVADRVGDGTVEDGFASGGDVANGVGGHCGVLVQSRCRCV